MSRAQTTDLLIIGGGIVGLTAAIEARRRDPSRDVVLIEKEETCGRHASGRNSGVLHAGFYYTADSLKARFSVEGNRRLTAYCLERGLPILRCGKLVVARNEGELAGLDELLRRSRANGVALEEVSEAEARTIEPRARTHMRALFSPTTSSVDPRAVVAALAADARAAGVEIRLETAYTGRSTFDSRGIRTSTGDLSAGCIINAAGLYADRIARDFGFSDDHRILPFKGMYLSAMGGFEPLRVHIYPVPELDYPFLGVHYTACVDGRTKIGPTAVPALWREQYGGAASLEGFRAREAAEIGRLSAGLLFRDAFRFRTLAWRELRKRSKARLAALAAELLHAPPAGADWRWGRPGIRAQLVNVRERRLEMDFLLEGGGHTLHVLNAVSPAFTCAFPFAAHVLDEVERQCGGRGAAPNEASAAAGAA